MKPERTPRSNGPVLTALRAGVLALGLGAAACAGVDVHVEAEPGADLAGRESYSFRAGPSVIMLQIIANSVLRRRWADGGRSAGDDSACVGQPQTTGMAFARRMIMRCTNKPGNAVVSDTCAILAVHP